MWEITHTESYLIERSSQERCEGRNEGDGPVPASCSNGNTYQILFSNKALDVLVGIVLLQSFGKRGVLHVTIQSDYPRVITSQLHKGRSISWPSSQFIAQFVIWRRSQFYICNVHWWDLTHRCWNCEFQLSLVLQECLEVLQDPFSFGTQWFSVPVVLVLDTREVPSFEGLGDDRRGFAFDCGGHVKSLD